MTNKQGRVVVKPGASKLSLHKLRLLFATKVRKRRKENLPTYEKQFEDIVKAKRIPKSVAFPECE